MRRQVGLPKPSSSRWLHVYVERDERIRLPLWSWSYVTFRFADGMSSSLVALAVVLHYHLPLWALALTTAAMNLAGVPASFFWGTLMDRSPRRKAIVVVGFAMAAVGLLTLASLPAFPLFVGGAIIYTVFGVATSPAASTLVLQGKPRTMWARSTSTLSRRTGFAFLTGMVTSIAIGLGPGIASALDFRAIFAAAAVFPLAAAILASRTVPQFQAPIPGELTFDAELVQAGQRQFDRPVYFPSRITDTPTISGLRHTLLDPHRLWPLGYALTFMGSISFFSSYPGVLSSHLHLSAGLVLLAQAPSHIVTPITYPWAGRFGARVGESVGVIRGAQLRTATLPVLCLLMVLAGSGFIPVGPTLPIVMVLHGLMGLSFALIQVNGPIILAHRHPGGRGQGVGSYHAAIGSGTLLGSLAAFLLLRTLPYGYTYIFAVTAAGLGAALLLKAHRRERALAKGPAAPRPVPQLP